MLGFVNAPAVFLRSKARTKKRRTLLQILRYPAIASVELSDMAVDSPLHDRTQDVTSAKRLAPW